MREIPPLLHSQSLNDFRFKIRDTLPSLEDVLDAGEVLRVRNISSIRKAVLPPCCGFFPILFAEMHPTSSGRVCRRESADAFSRSDSVEDLSMLPRPVVVHLDDVTRRTDFDDR